MSEIYLKETALQLVANYKGILDFYALNEVSQQVRLDCPVFETTGIDSYFRELTLKSSELGKYISGVCLSENLLNINSKPLQRFVLNLASDSIVTGIRLKPVKGALSDDCCHTDLQDLDKAYQKLRKYRVSGFRFISCQIKISIHTRLVDSTRLMDCVDSIGRLALVCQSSQMVPIIRVKVIANQVFTSHQLQGKYKDIFSLLIFKLMQNGVQLEGVLLAINIPMQSGVSFDSDSNINLAKSFKKIFYQTIPPAIPGILIDNHNQNPTRSTLLLSTLNQFSVLPWNITFLLSHRLGSPMNRWQSEIPHNPVRSPKLLFQRARLSKKAVKGTYSTIFEL
jgi:fructose-bisphosphate aldolase, class I